MNNKEAVRSIYAVVAQEIDEGRFDRGLMAQAVAESKGSAEKAKSAYIRLRSARLHEELEDGLLLSAIGSPEEHSPALDNPIDSFYLKKASFLGAASKVVVRTHSITFLRGDGPNDVTVSKASDEWGIKLTASILHGRKLTLIHRTDGCTTNYLPSKAQYRIFSKWLESNKGSS